MIDDIVVFGVLIVEIFVKLKLSYLVLIDYIFFGGKYF